MEISPCHAANALGVGLGLAGLGKDGQCLHAGQLNSCRDRRVNAGGQERDRLPRAGAPGPLVCTGVRALVPTGLWRAGLARSGVAIAGSTLSTASPRPCPDPPPPELGPEHPNPQHTAGPWVPWAVAARLLLCLRCRRAEQTCSLLPLGSTPNPTRTGVRAQSSRPHPFRRGRPGESPRLRAEGAMLRLTKHSTCRPPLPQNGGNWLSGKRPTLSTSPNIKEKEPRVPGSQHPGWTPQ